MLEKEDSSCFEICHETIVLRGSCWNSETHSCAHEYLAVESNQFETWNWLSEQTSGNCKATQS